MSLQRLLRTLSLPADVLPDVLLAAHPGWDRRDVDSMAAGLASADAAIARSVVVETTRSQPLTELLGQARIPMLVFRADPAQGGLLADNEWRSIQQSLPAGSVACDLPGTSHEIHRERFDKFVQTVHTFVSRLIGIGGRR
jgi:hypothetical protein